MFGLPQRPIPGSPGHQGQEGQRCHGDTHEPLPIRPAAPLASLPPGPALVVPQQGRGVGLDTPVAAPIESHRQLRLQRVESAFACHQAAQGQELRVDDELATASFLVHHAHHDVRQSVVREHIAPAGGGLPEYDQARQWRRKLVQNLFTRVADRPSQLFGREPVLASACRGGQLAQGQERPCPAARRAAPRGGERRFQSTAQVTFEGLFDQRAGILGHLDEPLRVRPRQQVCQHHL